MEELIILLNDLKGPIINYLDETQKISFLDYLPNLVAALAVIASILIVVLQYRRNVALHRMTEIYNTKKEAILEALSFLDTYISWLDLNSKYIPARENTDSIALATKARTIHNKLCISCDNADIVQKFLDVVVPNVEPNASYPVLEKYNEFRNACREELGYKDIELPTDQIYLTIVTTRALEEHTNERSKDV